MKAFHHSRTNLISVWKSGPRTAVLSEKESNAALFAVPTPILHHRSNFFSDLIALSFYILQAASLSPANPPRSTPSHETQTNYTHGPKGQT